jgi:hypothetical protein
LYVLILPRQFDRAGRRVEIGQLLRERDLCPDGVGLRPRARLELQLREIPKLEGVVVRLLLVQQPAVGELEVDVGARDGFAYGQRGRGGVGPGAVELRARLPRPDEQPAAGLNRPIEDVVGGVAKAVERADRVIDLPFA